MAEAGLFFGWGEPITGREAKGLEVFAEALAYYGKAEQDGRIESQEAVFLNPHGGDLGGFILIRGSEAQITALRAEDEFERLVTRAAVVVQVRRPRSTSKSGTPMAPGVIYRDIPVSGRLPGLTGKGAIGCARACRNS